MEAEKINTFTVKELPDLEVFKAILTNVSPFSGQKVCRNGITYVYGFYYKKIDCDFWFKKKSDAVFATNIIRTLDWDGIGCLEMMLNEEFFSEFLNNGRKGEMKFCGKCYF